MKKTCFALVLLAFGANVFAQKINRKTLFRNHPIAHRNYQPSHLKSTSEYTLSLDSMTFYNKDTPGDSVIVDREIQTYSENGRLVNQIYYENNSNILEPVYKSIMRFSNDHDLLYELVLSWDEGSQEFINSYLDINGYLNGIQVSNTSFDNWDNTNKEWTSGYKDTSDYNLQNQKIRRQYFSWNPTTKVFQPGLKDTIIYTGFLIKEQNSYSYDPDQKIWIKIESQIYKRLSNDSISRIEYLSPEMEPGELEITQIKKFYYNKEIADFDFHIDSTVLFDTIHLEQKIIPNVKKMYEYYPNNKIKYISHINWNVGSDSWIPISKDGFGYDSNNRLNAEVYYNWDYLNNKWVGRDSSFYIFDNSGLNLTEEYFNWDVDIETWNGGRTDYYYTPGLGYKSIYVPFERDVAEMYFNNTHVIYGKTYNWNGAGWDEEGVGYFYYNPIVPDNEKIIASKYKTKIYPSPASSNITIEANNLKTNSFIKLYNTNGRLMNKYKVTSNKTTINVSHISPGIYIIEMETDKGFVREKIFRK